MSITPAQLAAAAAAAIDFNVKGQPTAQFIQKRPLLAAFRDKQKIFPGGDFDITLPVWLDVQSGFVGYTGDDVVAYTNETGVQRVSFTWRELHNGLEVTHTELKTNGISVVETGQPKPIDNSNVDAVRLFNLLEWKTDAIMEGSMSSLDLLFHQNGTVDPKGPLGIENFISTTPAVGVTGGIDRATTPIWRNRAQLGIVANPGNAEDGVLIEVLNSEYMQLTRYSKGPLRAFAGSAFIAQLRLELRARGYYTLDGWRAGTGSNQIKLSDVQFGPMVIEYDPTLDTQGKSKYMYWIDTDAIRLYVMDNQDMTIHNPPRPVNQYIFYNGITWTGQMVASQLNSSGVYTIA